MKVTATAMIDSVAFRRARGGRQYSGLTETEHASADGVMVVRQGVAERRSPS
jgi:hypothetical protein